MSECLENSLFVLSCCQCSAAITHVGRQDWLCISSAVVPLLHLLRRPSQQRMPKMSSQPADLLVSTQELQQALVPGLEMNSQLDGFPGFGDPLSQQAMSGLMQMGGSDPMGNQQGFQMSGLGMPGMLGQMGGLPGFSFGMDGSLVPMFPGMGSV